MRWPFGGTRSGLALLPLVALTAAALGLGEGIYHVFGPRPPRGVPGFETPDLLAYAALDALGILVPALLAALVAPNRRWLGVVWVGFVALFPTAFAFFDHVVHASFLPHFALSVGGPEHLVRIVGVAALLSLIAVAVALRPARRWLDFLERRHAVGFAAAAGLLVVPATAVVLGWRLPALEVPDKPARPGAANVLLLTIDTLRQDAVGAYGGAATPNLDALIAQGVRADGWAPASWTRPSVAAILGNLSETGTGTTKESSVSAEVPWWPERLQQAGYVTQAILCNPNLAARFGFDRGFDNFEHAGELERLGPIGQSVWARWLSRQVRGRTEPSRGDRLAKRAERWLDEARQRSAPWFLWVHLVDPHLPYHLRGADGALRDRDPPAWMDDLAGVFEDGKFTDLEGARDGRSVTTAGAREALHRLYLREVGFADHQAGRIVRAAQAASGDRPLVWILTSDHGEEFFEHGGFEHGHALHGEVLRVPLAMGGLDLPAGGHTGGMKLQDVGPTLLSLLGMAPFTWDEGSGLVEADSVLVPFVTGVDRLQQLRAAQPLPVGCEPVPMIAEGMLYGPPRTRVLRSSGESLWLDDATGHLLIGDVCLDPLEQSLEPLPTADERDRRLLQQLSAWRARLSDRRTVAPLDEDLQHQLRALGYVH